MKSISILRPLVALVSFAVLGWLISGCATLGTKTRVVDPSALSGVRSIAIAPVRLQPLAGRNLQAVELLARDIAENTLQDKFTEAGTFVRVVRSETLVAAQQRGEPELLAAARALGVDALLLVDLKLKPTAAAARQGETDWRECDALLQATMIGTRDGQPLITLSHDTYWANAYARTPDFETSIADAAIGVAGEITRHVRKP